MPGYLAGARLNRDGSLLSKAIEVVLRIRKCPDWYATVPIWTLIGRRNRLNGDGKTLVQGPGTFLFLVWQICAGGFAGGARFSVRGAPESSCQTTQAA